MSIEKKSIILFCICCSLLGCNTSGTAISNELKCNLKFERNRLIVTALLPDSTAMECEFDSGCINGYANIDSMLLKKVKHIQYESDSTNNSMLLNVGEYPLKYKCFINNYTKPLIGLHCKDSLQRWSVDIASSNISPIPNDSVLNICGYQTFPLQVVYGLLPIVEIPITLYKGDKKYSFRRSFLVDTGTPSSFCITDPDIELLNFVNDIPHCKYKDALTDDFNRQGRKRTYSRFILDSVAIFNCTIGKASCQVDVGVRSANKEFGGNVIGMVGMGVLKNFNIIFDYQNSQLLLAPHGIDMPFYEQAENSLGFTYSDKLRVSFIELGHNAQKAGLKPGDMILSINDIPLTELQNITLMDSIRNLPNGTQVRLKISRDDKVLDINYISNLSLK